MPGKSKIAIVILNWNGEKLFGEFLPSVIRNSDFPGTEIYVADNASTDNSIGFLQKDFPEVRIIRLEKNFGFAEGYNQALKQVEADYFVLLNSDVEVTPGWLAPCISMLERDEKLVAVQPKDLLEVIITELESLGLPEKEQDPLKIMEMLDDELTGIQMLEIENLLHSEDPEKAEKITKALEVLPKENLASTIAKLLIS